MKEESELSIRRINKKQIWDEVPVFCFTSDIDWASEDVISEYFNSVNELNLNPTLFVTHHSEIIERNFQLGNIIRGIHPNFLPNSSHGSNWSDIIENCVQFAPESYGFRCHRAFEVTDTSHLLKNVYNYKYVSHQITILQTRIRPILVESGLINFPVFFEDGTHLYNKLDFNLLNYVELFKTPGIKIISFHPMNFVFNSPTIQYMRRIKDSLSREEYSNISKTTIDKLKNRENGIKDLVIEIINFCTKNNLRLYNMNELYNLTIID
ncbi:MAG: hypothetical protein NTW16_05535 [Bacteroidetes bacterium]|nr:hypothetical protein [Bacteroidota bacterium]